MYDSFVQFDLKLLYCILQIIWSGKVLRFLQIDQQLQKFSSEIIGMAMQDNSMLPWNCECYPTNYSHVPQL